MMTFTSSTLASKGFSYQIGAALMLEEINRSPALLPGYELKVVWQDDHCNAGVGTMHILDNIFDKRYTAFAPGIALSDMDANRDGRITTEDVEGASQVWNASQVSPDPVGLVGPSCSNVALDVANIAHKGRLPLISATATRPILSDRSLYPSFFRTQSPDTAYSRPWIALARLLKQTSIVVVIAEAANWHSGATDLVKAADEQQVELVGQDLDHEISGFHGLQITMDSAAAARGVATELLRLKRRIVIFLLYDARARLVMCEAYRAGFLNAIYMPMGWFAPAWWTTPDTACTVGQLTQMAMSTVVVSVVSFRTDSDTPLSCSSSMSSADFKAELYARQVNASRDGYIANKDAGFVADAICMYAMMLHEVLVVRGLPLSELSARSPRAYSLTQAVLSHTDFQGVSGHMKFEPGQADPKASVIIKQVQPGGMADIATYTHPKFVFLGQANLTFQFQGEQFFAGPAGAEVIEAHLTPYVKCTKGKLPDLGSNTCRDCPPHMEFVQSAESCLCSEGYHAAPAGGCLPCAGGSYSNAAGTLECTMCQAGKYSPPGATACLLCPRGSFARAVGSSVCSRCPPLQTTREVGAAEQGMCVCDQGSYRSAPTASGTMCQACPTNANTSGIASTDVTECKCERDMYMSASGACVPCPPGSTTKDGGKTSVTSCLCNEGKYMPADATGCQPCPAAMRCPKGSNEANYVHLDLAQRTDEQQFPELMPRYWSSAVEPMSVFDCWDEKKCPGGVPGRACAAKMENAVACQHCEAAHHWDGDRCAQCKALRGLGYGLFALCFLGAPLLIVALYRFSGDGVELWGTRGNAVAGLGFVTLTHYQMIDLMASAALLPVGFRGSFDAISWTNDWFGLFQPDCAGVANLTTSMILKAASPAGAGLICVLTYAISFVVARVLKRPHLQMQRNRLFNIFGSLCFTFFGAISLMSMDLFKCSRNPNGRYTLVSDLGVECFSSGQWMSMLGIGTFCVLVYIVGLGSLFLRVVMIAPRHFQDQQFQTRWKFLFIRFHSGAYWWGVVHLAKNVIIELAFVIFSSGWRKLYCALAGLIVYTGIAMLVMPFRTITVNGVEVLSGGCVVYVTSMLLSFTDRDAGQSDTEVMVAIIAASASPLLLACIGIGRLGYHGKRAKATTAQVDRAQRDFENIVECSRALAAMDVDAGADLLLWLGDWERWACSHAAKVLRSDLLGVCSQSRIAHSKVPVRVRSSLLRSNSALRFSVVSATESKDGEGERGCGGPSRDGWCDSADGSTDGCPTELQLQRVGNGDDPSGGQPTLAGTPASGGAAPSPKGIDRSQPEPVPTLPVQLAPDEACIQELGSFLNMRIES